MRHRWDAALLLLAAAATPIRAAGAQASQPCRTTDTRVQPLADWVVRVATGTDSFAITQRSAFHIPPTTGASIAVVTDSATCQHAADAYSAALHHSSTTRRVFVVHADTVYVALDPDLEYGEWKVAITLGSTFAVLAKSTY